MCTIGYHLNNYIIEDLGHSWGTPLKSCLVLLFNKDLIMHLIIWETLHFQGFNMDMVFKSKWTSLTQRKVDKMFGVFFAPKVVVHNRVPSKQLHY